MDVLCVGQMVADILVQGADAVDFSVDTTRVDKISIQSGGDCLNTAIDLSLLGSKVGFTGVLGSDVLGRFLLDTARSKKIDARGVKVKDGVSTSSVIVLINSSGERVFLYYGGSNDRFSFQNIDPSLIEECRIVHVGGTYQLPFFDGEGAEKLFRLAKARGKMTSMDVTWDTSGRWMNTIEPCLPFLDLFLPSIGEAEKITGESQPEKMARVLKNKGVKHVAIKLGKRGCYVDAFGERFFQPAFDVEAVDTTGAGDAFVSGMLIGILRGWDIRRTAEFACAVSANCIQSLGATSGIISFEKIQEFLRSDQKSVRKGL